MTEKDMTKITETISENVVSENSACNISDIFPKYEQIILLDIETTGLSVDENQIIELAAIRYCNPKSRDQFGSDFEQEISIDLLVQLPDGVSIPQEIIELTNISNEMLAEFGISETEAATEFLKLFLPAEENSKTLIIAHNAQFDLSFIFKMLKKQNLKIPVEFDVLDTFTVFKDRKAYPHSLKDAIEYYQISGVENTHRAIDDVKALCEVVKCMKKERDDLDDYINLIGVHRVHGLWGDKIDGVSYCIQMLGVKRKRLPDFLKEGKRIYDPDKLKEVRPLIFKDE